MKATAVVKLSLLANILDCLTQGRLNMNALFGFLLVYWMISVMISLLVDNNILSFLPQQ